MAWFSIPFLEIISTSMASGHLGNSSSKDVGPVKTWIKRGKLQQKHPGNLKQTSQNETPSMETNCLANLRSLGIWNPLKCSHTNKQKAKLEKLPPYAWWCRGGTDQRPASWIWRQHQPLKKKTNLDFVATFSKWILSSWILSIQYLSTNPDIHAGKRENKRGNVHHQDADLTRP